MKNVGICVLLCVGSFAGGYILGGAISIFATQRLINLRGVKK